MSKTSVKRKSPDKGNARPKGTSDSGVVAQAHPGTPKGARGGQGGPGAGGGMNFHSAVLAAAAVHMLRGTSTGWLEEEATAVPVAVWAETKGPGDDIRLEFDKGKTAEAQVKRGLRVGDEPSTLQS